MERLTKEKVEYIESKVINSQEKEILEIKKDFQISLTLLELIKLKKEIDRKIELFHVSDEVMEYLEKNCE